MVTDLLTRSATPDYVGRFAPSPTGPLHFGSLLTAAGSFLRARQAGGKWLLRIEDIDPPREVPGASDEILHALEAYGFEWDGSVVYQHRRTVRYKEALDALSAHAFACDCSRKTLQADARQPGLPGGRYPGTCRDRGLTPSEDRAVRVRCDQAPGFDDLLQGNIDPLPGRDDFVVWRRDDLPAYQVAVTVDDAAQGITEVVRGCDLLATTPRQIHLIRCLGYATPVFAHLPIAVTQGGQKLSKQTGARALDTDQPSATLCNAFAALGLRPAPALKYESVSQLWRWATQTWSPKSLKGKRTIPPGRA